MFRCEAAVIEEAYNQRGTQIAYQEEHFKEEAKPHLSEYDVTGVTE